MYPLCRIIQCLSAIASWKSEGILAVQHESVADGIVRLRSGAERRMDCIQPDEVQKIHNTSDDSADDVSTDGWGAWD